MKFFIDEKTTGSVYVIRNGELIQCPMSTDNTVDTEDFAVVDWDFLVMEPPLIIDGVEIDLYKHVKNIETVLTK